MLRQRPDHRKKAVNPFVDSTSQSIIGRRIVSDSDKAFLLELYRSTRLDIQMSPMTDEQKASFIEMQFHAQHHHYQQHFPEASFEIILRHGVKAGRLYVNESDREIRLIDITLLPNVRNRKIGEMLITELQQRSIAKSLPLRLRVEPDNPALRLYRRLGFQMIADEGVNLHLEWTDSIKHKSTTFQ